MDQAEWFEASQEEAEREAVARQEDDWKSEVLSIAAAEDHGYFGPGPEVQEGSMRVDWEDGMDGWDADLPSSQMHGAVGGEVPFGDSSGIVSEADGVPSFVDLDVGEEQEAGQDGEADESADRTGSGVTSFFEDFSDPVTSPVTSPERCPPGKVGPASERIWTDQDVKVTVLAPASPSNPAGPFSGGSDVILSSEDDDILQPRVPSSSSAAANHRKRGFIPSPSHRRISKKPLQAKRDASSSEDQSEVKDEALAKFKQDLRARFSHRGGGSAIVGPVGADPKSALARGKRLTLATAPAFAPGSRKRRGPADLADVLDPPPPPSRMKRKMERKEEEEEEEQEEVRPRARSPLSKKRADAFGQATVTNPRLQSFMFGR